MKFAPVGSRWLATRATVPPRLVGEHPGGVFRRLLTVVEAHRFGLIVVGEWQVLQNGSWVTVLLRRIRMSSKTFRRAEYQRAPSWDGSIIASPPPDSSCGGSMVGGAVAGG